MENLYEILTEADESLVDEVLVRRGYEKNLNSSLGLYANGRMIIDVLPAGEFNMGDYILYFSHNPNYIEEPLTRLAVDSESMRVAFCKNGSLEGIEKEMKEINKELVKKKVRTHLYNLAYDKDENDEVVVRFARTIE